MPILKLTRGKYCLVDNESLSIIDGYKWFYNHGYACANIKSGKRNPKKIYMHKLLLSARDNQRVDHINRIKLDNRLKNLRIATPAENRHNSLVSNGKSGIRGIYYIKKDKAWQGIVKKDGKYYYCGQSVNINKVIPKYIAKSIEVYGEYSPYY